MRRLWVIIGLLAALALIGVGFWFFWPRLAPVSPADLAPQVVVSAPEPATTPLDSRLVGLSKRADGARLFWDNPENNSILSAAFADDGSFVVSATDSGGYHIVALDLSTRQVVRRIDSKLASIASANRPSNRNANAFCYSEMTLPGKTMEVWCRNTAWENPRRLTTHDGPEDLINPTISPDGSFVAFEVIAPGNRRSSTATGTIWSVSLDGSGLKQLTRGADDRGPSWNDDGSLIYFQRHLPDGSWDIYSMGFDGTEPAPALRTFEQDELGPAVVPGGDVITMVASASGTPNRVRSLNVETKAGEWLTTEGLGPESFVSISPDGKLIGFVAPVDASATSTRLGVWLKILEPKI